MTTCFLSWTATLGTHIWSDEYNFFVISNVLWSSQREVTTIVVFCAAGVLFFGVMQICNL
jgi:hypothetical protein